MDICRSVEPADIDVDGRTVKCHLYAEGIAAKQAPALASIPA
jgi:hypothetical protein